MIFQQDFEKDIPVKDIEAGEARSKKNASKANAPSNKEAGDVGEKMDVPGEIVLTLGVLPEHTSFFDTQMESTAREIPTEVSFSDVWCVVFFCCVVDGIFMGVFDRRISNPFVGNWWNKWPTGPTGCSRLQRT